MQYKNNNVQHESDFGQLTYAHISGYSIDPKRTIEHIIGLLYGLCHYPKEWYCDHNINEDDPDLDTIAKYIPGGPDRYPHRVNQNTIIHNGFIDEITYGPMVMLFNKNTSKYEFYNEFKNTVEFNVEYGFVAFKSGYIVLRFINDNNPVKITLDISTTNKIDLDLIVDHLRAPSEKQDGLGLFDVNYNIYTKPIENNILGILSENRNKARIEDFDYTKIICLYCDSAATHWDIASSKSIPVCINHFKNRNLPYREIKYYGGTIYESGN